MLTSFNLNLHRTNEFPINYSETTRQFDDIIKYDNFLKFLKS